jgi:DNA-nicking Smr family endonuclease
LKDKDLWKKFTENIKPLAREEIPKFQEKHLEKKIDVAEAPPAFKPSKQLISNQKAFNPDKPADIDRNTFVRLKKGQLPIEATLDLHGLTVAQAHALVHQKLREWQMMGKRCVLVITGKGLRSENHREALRYRFPLWLNEPPLRSLMLAFTPAQLKDGGVGAFYVLLKAQKGYDT